MIVDRIICRYIGPLLTATTIVIVAAAASALFLPYYSFIDSRLTKSITIFLFSNEMESMKAKNHTIPVWKSMINQSMND